MSYIAIKQNHFVVKKKTLIKKDNFNERIHLWSIILFIVYHASIYFYHRIIKKYIFQKIIYIIKQIQTHDLSNELRELT